MNQVIHVDICVTNAATARASVHMQVHRTRINSHYLLLRQIWQTAQMMDLQ